MQGAQPPPIILGVHVRGLNSCTASSKTLRTSCFLFHLRKQSFPTLLLAYLPENGTFSFLLFKLKNKSVINFLRNSAKLEQRKHVSGQLL